MSKSDETPSTPAGDDRNLVTADQAIAAHDLEETVRQFWAKYRTLFMGAVVIALLVILGQEGVKLVGAKRLEATQSAYAAAESDNELKAFAVDHPGDPLAGAAHLRVGDNAFAAGNYADAIVAYDAAAEVLADTIFASRIRLGRAMAVLRNGDSLAGSAALQELANDTTATTAARGEAAYHLAAIATAAGDADRVNELVNQISAINPASTWSQRAVILQATVVENGS